MLLRFSVENFRSYSDRQTLDLTATTSCHEMEKDNTFIINGERLLKSAAVYGANASGKSNLFEAVGMMGRIIKISSKESSSLDKFNIIPFFLKGIKEEIQPSVFEIEFIIDDTIFRYGFALTSEEIKSEWLFKIINNDETPLFLRTNEDGNDLIEIFAEMKNAQGKNLEELTRNNALFLSVCDQFNVTIAKRILGWFSSKINIINGLNDEGYLAFTLNELANENMKDEILTFIRNADVNIVDLEIETTEIEDENEKIKKRVKLASIHNIYDNEKNIIGQCKIPFNSCESEGTKKAFALSGPIIDTLKRGGVLFVDELDARLHPIFTSTLIRMFNSKKENPNNAQLIFATHDTNLLSDKKTDRKTKKQLPVLRRDQIFFTEKNNSEATELYSLIDFMDDAGKKIRKDASREKDYLSGRYGAIPFLGELIQGVKHNG